MTSTVIILIYNEFLDTPNGPWFVLESKFMIYKIQKTSDSASF